MLGAPKSGKTSIMNRIVGKDPNQIPYTSTHELN